MLFMESLKIIKRFYENFRYVSLYRLPNEKWFLFSIFIVRLNVWEEVYWIFETISLHESRIPGAARIFLETKKTIFLLVVWKTFSWKFSLHECCRYFVSISRNWVNIACLHETWGRCVPIVVQFSAEIFNLFFKMVNTRICFLDFLRI